MAADHAADAPAPALGQRGARGSTKGTATWTSERLRRTVRRLAAEGIVEASLLGRTERRPAEERLVAVVAGIAIAAPVMTLQRIAAQLEVMRERTPRGGTRWHPSSVRNLPQRAKRLELLGHRAPATTDALS